MVHQKLCDLILRSRKFYFLPVYKKFFSVQVQYKPAGADSAVPAFLPVYISQRHITPKL